MSEPPKTVDDPLASTGRQVFCQNPIYAEAELSEKAAKKLAAKAEKEAKKADRAQLLLEQQRQSNAALMKVVESIEIDTYGYLPLCTSTMRTKRVWHSVRDVDETLVSARVWIRGRLQESRCKGALGFLVLRNQAYTLQAVISTNKSAIKFAGSLPLESIVDVYGEVVQPSVEICGATQRVELLVEKIFCVSKALPELPFQLRDANRPENDLEEEGAIRVSQDTRLDNRVLDLRTLANQAIFRISSQVCQLFRDSLTARGFIEIHSPKLIGGASEGGSNVFKFEYFGRPGCLAQSPQLYKQMATCADMDRVFEIGPVFRAENSNTHRHLCEFTGLDFEMAFKEHYFEVLEVAEEMFHEIFSGLNERCAKEIEAVYRQYPAEPFKFGKQALRLNFADGLALLREHHIGMVPEDISTFDLSTEQEKALGKLIREKFDTDFYYMINYPLGVRPFYTMPAPHDSKLSNSYDFFMRGEEILSGAQRVHDPELLTQRATECGIDVNTIKEYIDSFSLGAYPHAGIGVGLERVVMLFLGLNNIRKSSLFPRDPKRLSP